MLQPTSCEVKPEQGRGRSRVIEIQQKESSKQKKRLTKTATENANLEEKEDDECEYYYKPVIQSQGPSYETTMEHDVTRGDNQETLVLNTDEPVFEERLLTNTNEPDIQQENVLQEEDDQSEDLQPVGQDEIPESLCPASGEYDREQRHDLQRRERRAPKIFTYDRLGTPACYSAAHANEMLYQYQPALYRRVQPMWTNQYHFYQPVLMQTY